MTRNSFFARGLWAACLSLLLVAACLIPVASANAAAVTVSGLRVVYGDKTLSLSWNSLGAGVTYRAQYATNATYRNAKHTNVTSSTSTAITGLKNKQQYRVRVVAKVAGKTVYSASKSAAPSIGYPSVMPTVNVKPGPGANQLLVTWSKLQRATRVIVLAGSDNQQSASFFTSPWLNATATSAVITIPEKYRWLIGSGTGNAIYVKVGQYNNATAKTIRLARSDATAYRLSLSNKYSFATPLPVTGSTGLKVATYNVQSVAASAPGHPWSERLPRVINNILYSSADLIGLQEADAAVSMNYQNRQIANGLASHGYLMSGDTAKDYKSDNGVIDSWFYYKADVLTRLEGGIVSPRDDLNMSWPAGKADARGTWAKFRINATGEIFYALDMHLPVGASDNALRTREAAALSDYIQHLAGNQPTVFLGDFNSAPLRDGYCAASKLHDLGWYDTANTINRMNYDLQTANSPESYPTGKPERALNVNKGRIDYIMTKNMGGAARYINQQVLNADGTVNLTYQGSDHNLQLATLMF